MLLLGGARRRLFGISAEETSFARRGFAATTASRQQHLEQIGRTFIAGYNAAVSAARPSRVAPQLDAVAEELRGFAFEGAAMGFALLDLLLPWPSRHFARFVAGPASAHIYPAYVGAGMALAQTSLRLMWRLEPLDPLLRWLLFDGYGVHTGYFHASQAIVRRRVPPSLHGHQRDVFDQGLGRAIWFVSGARIDAVVAAVKAFPVGRRSNLWSGVGHAAAYAGGVEQAELTALEREAGAFRPQLAQGAASAAEVRARAGNPAAHTGLACRVFCHMEADEAAAIAEATLPTVPPDDHGEAFLAWRAAIAARIDEHLKEGAT